MLEFFKSTLLNCVSEASSAVLLSKFKAEIVALWLIFPSLLFVSASVFIVALIFSMFAVFVPFKFRVFKVSVAFSSPFMFKIPEAVRV